MNELVYSSDTNCSANLNPVCAVVFKLNSVDLVCRRRRRPRLLERTVQRDRPTPGCVLRELERQTATNMRVRRSVYCDVDGQRANAITWGERTANVDDGWRKQTGAANARATADRQQ